MRGTRGWKNNKHWQQNKHWRTERVSHCVTQFAMHCLLLTFTIEKKRVCLSDIQCAQNKINKRTTNRGMDRCTEKYDEFWKIIYEIYDLSHVTLCACFLCINTAIACHVLSTTWIKKLLFSVYSFHSERSSNIGCERPFEIPKRWNNASR